MSRSLKKNKIFGITSAQTEKQDKRLWNRKFREICRKLIHIEKDPPVKIQSVTNVWDGSKDGKRYHSNASKKDMRK